MAKENTGAEEKTTDIFKKGRGRPKEEGAMTGAERIAKLRAERKAQGLCTCCGQELKK